MSIVKVNQEKCIGCGACVAIDPENFDFNDDGISTVINETANEKAKDAEEVCPVCAIDIVEETEVENNTVEDKATDTSETEHECHCKHCDECEDDECNGDECECNSDGDHAEEITETQNSESKKKNEKKGE